MRALPVRTRLTSWIAVFAILLASLVPSLSQAMGFEKGMSWIEVCTAQGSKWVADDAGDSGTPATTKHLLEHCPYCSIHSPALGMPPATISVAEAVDRGHEVPLAFLAAPRTLHAWVSAQPRAPPALS